MFWVVLKKFCSPVTLQIHVIVQLFCPMKHLISTKIDFTIAFQNSPVQQNVCKEKGKEKTKKTYELRKNGGERSMRKGKIPLLGWLEQLEELSCLKVMGEFNKEICHHTFSGLYLVFFPTPSSLLQEITFSSEMLPSSHTLILSVTTALLLQPAPASQCNAEKLGN